MTPYQRNLQDKMTIGSSSFRSEEMAMTQLFLPTDSAYFCVAELGELGQVQFRDLNPSTNAFQRRFVNEVKRCDDMERQLRYILTEIKKESLPVPQLIKDQPKAPPPKEMIDMESTFSKIEDELKEINKSSEQLKRMSLELLEWRHVLQTAEQFVEQGERRSSTGGIIHRDDGFHSMTPDSSINLTFLSGVIPREKLMSFERLLWRVSRGNVFLRQTPIELPLEDPYTGDWQLKNVVVAFFQGEQLKSKVKKIMQAFHATIYSIEDKKPSDRQAVAENVRIRIEDLKKVRQETQDHRSRVLIAAARKISSWFVQVRKMKATFHTLNMCNMDITSKCLVAEAWVPLTDVPLIQNALNRGQVASGSNVHPILHRVDSDEVPPTYNRTNKFTRGFQNIIDAYGVATYQEINPTAFTVITFPFLFAVMFGDAGHGLIMFLFALWMVMRERSLSEDKSDNEIWDTFFGGRYIILLMGAFSIYTGLIYNDVFSKSVNVFGSGWSVPERIINGEDSWHSLYMLDPTNNFSKPYPFGLDPVWAMASNKIQFTNSFKMKTSVILGVMQMLFGVFLSLSNHLFHKDMLSVYTEFIPQLLFLCLIFGYLVITIFYKWASFFKNTFCAPSLLLMLINMLMYQYVESDDEKLCYTKPLYDGQKLVQTAFLVIALMCVPWMLFIKPFVLRHRHQQAQKIRASSTAPLNVSEDITPPSPILTESLDQEDQNSRNHHIDGWSGNVSNQGVQQYQNARADDLNFGDLFINQIIHTIEYVLGSVSHTASYLRLWALSLAHARKLHHPSRYAISIFMFISS